MAASTSPTVRSQAGEPSPAQRHPGVTLEPIWWALFSAGGMISAMFFPILMVITGIIIPFGLAAEGAVAYERVYGTLAHPLVKLLLFPLIALPLFHWAHRFLYTLLETGFRSARAPLSTICYGTAILGTLVTAIVLWRL